ncbi:MAG: tetratricopeptide repeat protein [Candidatus Cryptobacteroides sp.]
MKKSSVVFIFLSVIVLSCGNPQVTQQLDAAEAVMGERPDSALAIIRSIDTLSLKTRSVAARYSLLHAMALDKNYIDTTDISIIRPAVEYYARHGTPDDKLKAYYHQGIIYSNKRDFKKAAIAYSMSENEFESSADNKYKGLLSMAYADLFAQTYNTDKEIEYIQNGIEYYNRAGDVTGYYLAHINLASAYQRKQNWVKADSLFCISLNIVSKDSLAMPILLSAYAHLKVLMPEKDPSGAISLLQAKYRDYHSSLSLKDYCVFAFASESLGDVETCNNILNMFESLDDSARKQTAYWEYRIYELRNLYTQAIQFLKLSYVEQDEIVSNLLNDSVEEALTDYYKTTAEQYQQDLKVTCLSISLFATLTFLFMYLLVTQINNKRKREKEQYESMLRIAENTNLLLKQANMDLREKRDGYEVERQKLIEKADKSQEKLEQLQRSFAQLYKDKFAAIGEMCSAYLYTKNRVNKQELIYRRVQKQISLFIGDEKLQAHLESLINNDLDDIVSHLKVDIPQLSQTDILFVCYCIIGFDPGIISTLLNISVSNVYTKKSRLRERIKKLDSQYADEYLRMI